MVSTLRIFMHLWNVERCKDVQKYIKYRKWEYSLWYTVSETNFCFDFIPSVEFIEIWICINIHVLIISYKFRLILTNDHLIGWKAYDIV